jgi:hypothetical protein
MRKVSTEVDKLKKKIAKLTSKLYHIERDKEFKENELEQYCKTHRSVTFDGLETKDINVLSGIYKYFDKRYPIEWQGGIRCDNRGMRLFFWLDSDPDYLIIHLTSTSENICFSGSTSWLVKAVSLEDKVNVIKTIKNDIGKLIKNGV